MDAAQRGSRHQAPWAPVIAVTAIAVLGGVVGLFESAFGPYYPVLIGAAVAGLGLLVRGRQPVWGLLLLVFGVAMAVGALAYVLLGLLQQGAPGSGSGSGVG